MGDYVTQVNAVIQAERALRIAQDESKKGTDEYNEA